MEIDWVKSESELGLGRPVILELFKEYLKEAEGLLAKLEAAVASGDYTALVSAAHTLKGSSGNLRLTQIQDAARAVEMAGKEKKDRAAIGELIKDLRALHEELRKLTGNV